MAQQFFTEVHMETKASKRAFNTDPFIGCPFDSSELKLVESAEGISIGQRVSFRDIGEVRLFGVVQAIGAGAKYGDGTTFTAVLINSGDTIFLKTTDDIYKASEI